MQLILFLLIFGLCDSATFYVANNGSNSNPGSINLPFKTIAHAQYNLRKNLNQNNRVFIFPGTYNEELVFTSLDSAQDGYFNIYQSIDPNNKPILFGGKLIENSWTYDPTTKSYKTNVGAGTKSRQLFVNNRRAKRATGQLPPGTTITATGYQLPSGYESWSSWTDQSNLEFVETKLWVQMRCLVEDISSTGAITMQQPCWKYARGRGGATQFANPSWIENNLALLSEPDEWYLNPTTGDLHYIPKPNEPIEKSVFHLPVSERLVYGMGNNTNTINNINFVGLIFLAATWNGPNEGGLGFPEIQANVLSNGQSPIGSVEFQYGRNINIIECVFTQLGGIAILMGTGTQYCSIQSNIVYDTSSVAIKIGDEVGNRPNKQDQTGNNLVYSNKVMYNGQEFNGAPAVMIGYCYNCTIAHNDISFTPYTGISHSWGWTGVISNFEGSNMITNNLVNQTMLALFDGGDFYTLGTQDVARSTCKENVFLGSQNCYGSLYLDDGSRYWDVYYNVVFGNVMTALIKGGDHNIHDNYWQNKGTIPHCTNHKDISFENNGYNCAPCNPKCAKCGPINLNNNHEIKELSQAPQAIVDNAGLVKELKFPKINVSM